MKKSRIFSGILAFGLVAAMSLPIFAADIVTDGGKSSVPVELTVQPAMFSVTVPTALPIYVAADGTITVASDVAIVNNSHGAVKVTNMTIEGVGDWEIVDFDSANMASEKVGATKVAMVINNDKTTGDDAITFTTANFPKLDGKNASTSDELPIVYDAKVPAQSNSFTSYTVANVVFTVGWDAATTNVGA